MQTMKLPYILLVLTLSLLQLTRLTNTATQKPSKKPLPKDPGFITDADLESLYDQWEETDDEKLPPDELEPHLRPRPSFGSDTVEKLSSNPEKLLSLAKKGKPVMAFVNVAGDPPNRQRTEELTGRWQIGLQNAHVKVNRFVIEDNRVLFVFEDGSNAYEYKQYILDQPEVSEYSIDGQTFHGKGFKVEYIHADKSANKSADKKEDGRPVERSGNSVHDEL